MVLVLRHSVFNRSIALLVTRASAPKVVNDWPFFTSVRQLNKVCVLINAVLSDKKFEKRLK